MKQFEQAIAEANVVFGRLDARGQKWKNRNVPIYIREQLWVPYYLTVQGGEQQLYTIRPPDEIHPKVYFARGPD